MEAAVGEVPALKWAVKVMGGVSWKTGDEWSGTMAGSSWLDFTYAARLRLLFGAPDTFLAILFCVMYVPNSQLERVWGRDMRWRCCFYM
jgi:hypothetical protein